MKLRTTCPCCTSRRGFIGGLAALGASAVLPAARAEAPSRIDVHHHIFPREVLDLQESSTRPGVISSRRPRSRNGRPRS